MKAIKTLVAVIGMTVAVFTINAETIPGCGDRTNGFSVTTGQSCFGNMPTPITLPTNVVSVPASNQILTVETVASNLWMFQSKPAFMSWALRRVSNLDLEFRSPVMVASGGYSWGWSYSSLSPSIDEMSDTVASVEVSFPIATSGLVTVTVKYLDTNWVALFEGSSEKYTYQDYPQPTNGVMRWSLYGKDPEVTIAKNIRVTVPGARYLQIFPEDGGEPIWLSPDSNGGFLIPRNVIGSRSVIVAIDSNWNQIAFDVPSGSASKVGEVHANVRPTIEGTQVLTNVNTIVIRPEAEYRRGSDILTEVTYTSNVSGVRLVVRTSEGETAQKVIIVNVATGDSGEFPINWNEDLELDFSIGRYHVIPIWWNFQDSTFESPYNSYRGGSGAVTPVIIEEK